MDLRKNEIVKVGDELMTQYELIFVTLPLMALLVGIVVYEVHTGLIRDIVTIPSAIYFLIASCVVGSHPWWHYFLGLFATLCFFFLITTLLRRIFGKEFLGGGGIKLLAVVGSAFGIIMVSQTVIIFIISTTIVFAIAAILIKAKRIPSSPMILFSVLCTLLLNKNLL